MRNLLLTALLLLLLSPSFAQRKSRAERERIMEQIRLSHNLLKNTNQEQDESIVVLATLNNQIRLQEELVDTYKREIVQASEEIDSLENRLCVIEEELQEIREEYARLANVTYRKLGNENKLLYLLGSRSLGEAYARISYFRQIGRHRQRQIDRLTQSTESIREQKHMLSERILARKNLISSEKEELGVLEGKKKEHNSLYFALKDKEEAYRKRLISQRENLRKLLAANENKPKPVPKPRPVEQPAPTPPPKPATRQPDPAPANETAKPVRPASTPALTGQFAQNKGRLPWPVNPGNSILAGKFGLTSDAFGNRITNDGIFLQTPQNERVMAVFSGTVTGVTEVPLSGVLVIVEHGNYRTAYAGLENVQVQPGDQVNTGQQLGNVYTDGRTGETQMQFMVYRAPNRFENPSGWLQR
ncbi:MAG: peptidoglycan DD-metalloendopeptidase family protein [Bacteroidia bacterium]